MAEYIDRGIAISKFSFYQGERIPETDVDGFPNTITFKDVKSVIRGIPAADVVEVVRCQNCAYSHKGCDSDMTKEIWCTYWQKTEGKAWNMMHFDDFCSHGAKMDLKDLEG